MNLIWSLPSFTGSTAGQIWWLLKNFIKILPAILEHMRSMYTIHIRFHFYTYGRRWLNTIDLEVNVVRNTTRAVEENLVVRVDHTTAMSAIRRQTDSNLKIYYQRFVPIFDEGNNMSAKFLISICNVPISLINYLRSCD